MLLISEIIFIELLCIPVPVYEPRGCYIFMLVQHTLVVPCIYVIQVVYMRGIRTAKRNVFREVTLPAESARIEISFN